MLNDLFKPHSLIVCRHRTVESVPCAQLSSCVTLHSRGIQTDLLLGSLERLVAGSPCSRARDALATANIHRRNPSLELGSRARKQNSQFKIWFTLESIINLVWNFYILGSVCKIKQFLKITPLFLKKSMESQDLKNNQVLI